jgi:hypothetical protein
LKDPSMSSHFLSGISKGFGIQSFAWIHSFAHLSVQKFGLSQNMPMEQPTTQRQAFQQLEGEDHIWYMLMTIAMYHCHGFVALISNLKRLHSSPPVECAVSPCQPVPFSLGHAKTVPRNNTFVVRVFLQQEWCFPVIGSACAQCFYFFWAP